ncbi:uncharacterized protein TRIADDRAFT_53774 [Trichoplax adhaerens]|uniref:Protein-tyrosine-phosphatase n=1 Tax=Trichoplax adhaerens TaxID=10228 RepID=B3RQ47_TRIAD|nr:hypothetical protein TRIADDRAFT_53774 [Trichoplax adhaerens]EDV27756.1 hypothetical protein TRIADDRAFT_53774 [Trichoplax adhaerens]|eukprot:XP_002109590.1 hypothetical protein TRIADDRAFT_53774 [Trichoplax adhaerens]
MSIMRTYNTSAQTVQATGFGVKRVRVYSRNILLDCQITATAGVQYSKSWDRNGNIQISNSSRFSILQNGLLIRTVQVGDNGTYTCTVRYADNNNNPKSTLAKGDLIVEAPPSPPTKPIVTAISSKSIILLWNPPLSSGNSPITTYIVEYRTASTSWATVLQTLSNNNVNISNLRPKTFYYFRIKAANIVGTGSESPFTTVETLQAEPSAPPQNINIVALQVSNTLRISWQPPPVDQQYGTIAGYNIAYKPSGVQSIDFEMINIGGSTTTADLNNLSPYTTYSIKIRANNSIGFGPYSQIYEKRTREIDPQASPQQIRGNSVTSSVITLTWQPPDPFQTYGSIIRYQIRAQLTSNTNIVRYFDQASDSASIIQRGNATNLNKFTTYTMTVRAYNSAGPSPWSSSIRTTTLEDIPGTPSGVTILEITDRTIRLSWNTPIDQNGIIISYRLRQCLFNTSTCSTWQIYSNTTFSGALSSLQANTNYGIQLAASTSVGFGKMFQQSVTTALPINLPEAPGRPSPTVQSATSVSLSWSPPISTGSGLLSHYKLTYNKRAESTWTQINVRANETQYTVTNLAPYTYYRFRVYAVNTLGSETPSPITSYILTFEAIPSAAPQNVVAIPIRDTSLLIKWQAPPSSHWNGILLGYTIVYQQRGSTLEQSVNVDGAEKDSFQFSQLLTNTDYEIRIQARNSRGGGVFSRQIIARTRERAPSQAPSPITTKSINATAIEVKWGLIPDGAARGIIMGYKIRYWREIVAGISIRNVNNATATSTIISGLVSERSYYVQVLGYTSRGDGPASSPPNYVYVSPLIPSAPQGITFSSISSNSLRINWVMPYRPNKPILQFRIGFALNSATQLQNIYIAGNSTFNFRHNNLLSRRDYKYQVCAENAAGWGCSLFYIVRTESTIGSIPALAQSIRYPAETIGAQSFVMLWNNPAGTYPIRYYRVRYSSDGSTWFVLDELIPPSPTSFILRGFQPNTRYFLQVISTNDYNNGFWSSSIQAQTLPTWPSQVPSNVLAQVDNSTTILVTWTGISTTGFNGVPLGYRLRYRIVDNANVYTVLQSANTTAFRYYIQGLLQYSTYGVSVAAYNSNGTGPYSNEVTVQTQASAPSAAPTELNIVSKTATSVTLSWTAPPSNTHNGVLRGYLIDFWLVQNNSTKKQVNTNSIITQYTINNLRSFAEYAVLVKAFNGFEGPASVTVRVTTSQSVPGAPFDIAADNVERTTVAVTWLPPDRPNGEITSYEVQFGLNTARELNTQVVPDPNQRRLNIAMSWNSTSIISIRARNSIGFGVKLTKYFVNVYQYVRLQYSGTSVGSVTLTWTPAIPRLMPNQTNYIEYQDIANNSNWISAANEIPVASTSFQLTGLKLNTKYRCRLIVKSADKAYIKSVIGIAQGETITGSGSQQFYQQWWFIVIIAVICLIVLILLIATLYWRGKSEPNKNTVIFRHPEARNSQISEVRTGPVGDMDLNGSMNGIPLTARSSYQGSGYDIRSTIPSEMPSSRPPSTGLPSHINDGFSDEEDERSMSHHPLTDDDHYQRPPIDVRQNGLIQRTTMNRFNELVIDETSEENDDGDETDYQQNRSFFVTRRQVDRPNNAVNNYNNRSQGQHSNQLPPHLRSNGFLVSNQTTAPSYSNSNNGTNGSNGNRVTVNNNRIDPPPFTITKLSAPRATVTTDDDSEFDDPQRLRSRFNQPPSSLSELPSRRPNRLLTSHSPSSQSRDAIASDSLPQSPRGHLISRSPPRSPPRSPTRGVPRSPVRSPTRSPPRRGRNTNVVPNGRENPLYRQESPPPRGRGMPMRGRTNGVHQPPIMQRSNGQPHFNDSPSLSESDGDQLDDERVTGAIPQRNQPLPIPPQRTESLRGKKSTLANVSRGRGRNSRGSNLRDRLKRLPQKRSSFPYRIEHLRHDNESVQSTDSSIPSMLEEPRNVRSPRQFTQRDIVQNYRDNVVRASMRLKGLKHQNGNIRSNLNKNPPRTNGNLRTNGNVRGGGRATGIPSVYYHSEQGRVKPGLPDPSYFI